MAAVLVAPILTQAAGADTLLVQLGQGRLFAAAAIAIIVATIVLVLVLVALVVALIHTRRLIATADQLSRRIGDRAEPIMERGRAIAESLEFIARSLRGDVQRVSETVTNLSDRLERAADAVEERVDDFHALLQVMQGEAEDLFLDTASTVRGVRAGMRRFGRRGAPDLDAREDDGSSERELPRAADVPRDRAEHAAAPADPDRALRDR